MKQKLLFISICLFLLWNGSWGKCQDFKSLNLYFAVSKCSYGIKAHVDSIAFEIKKPLIKEWNIKINKSAKKQFTKSYEAGDFRVQILMSLKDLLNIRVFEGKKEIFLFKQKKNSSVKYIFYDRNSEPYLIETILTTDQNSFGGGISRPPILIKKVEHIKYKSGEG